MLVYSQKAIFLDRDGTINVDTGYVHTMDAFIWLPGVIEALQLLKRSDYLLIVVSNQSGIARKFYTIADLLVLQKQINQELKKYHCPIDAWYFCPHLPKISGPCTCRKPKPGLLFTAINEHQIDPGKSWLIGDHLSDVQAARAANIPAIKLVGHVDQENESALALGCPIFPDLLTAAQSILAQA